MRIILAAALVLFAVAAQAQPIGPSSGSPATPTGNLPFTPAYIIDILDYGARCDGVTNDDAAINAALTAAAASVAYQNNDAIHIVGTADVTHQGCVFNSLNFTQFNKGTGANLRPRVEFSDFTGLCTGAGNTCLDLTGADLVHVHDVSIRGDSTPGSVPEICIQTSIVAQNASSAWHRFERVHCNNAFTFAALYNMGSEANSYPDSMFANSHTASGPIGTLGAITGGSAYTNGTYTGVALTGGSCATGATIASCALATIVVSGNAVTAVTLTYQGRDYVPADTLSAAAANIGGTGTGFSVPVSTVIPYAGVFDGQNYWRAASAFVSITAPANTWESLTLLNFSGTHFRQLGTGGGVWMGWVGGARWVNSYILSSGGVNACLDMFDNGLTKSGIAGPNLGFNGEINCEGAAPLLSMIGANATPTLYDFKFRGGVTIAAGGAFSTAVNVTAVTLQNADIDMYFVAPAANLFTSAKLWTVAGRVVVPAAVNWNAPASFSGMVCAGTFCTNPQVGPVDALANPALAISCSRLLNPRVYTGPLCQVTRSSDSAVADLYPNTIGDLDPNGYQAFCVNTTCKVNIAYRQDGSGLTCTQTTAASQPTLTLSVSQLGGRPGMVFGSGTALALLCPQDATINNIFAAGGYVSAVVYQPSNAGATAFLAWKNNGAGSPSIGWFIQVNNGGTSQVLTQGATTSNGTFLTGGLGTVTHVFDYQYSSASLSNVGTIGSNGTVVSVTPVAPVGTVTTDAAQNLIIGNKLATAGVNGYPGDLAEIVAWKTTPTAAQIEAVRRNQGAYYGLGATVN